MKTPMQEVYENFNLMSDADFKAWMLNTDLLEKEKERMCHFADNFVDDECGATMYDGGCYLECYSSTEEYFDKTFKTKER